MRNLILAAACVLAASPAIAADLGGPKPQPPAVIKAEPFNPLKGCFVEASIAGTFLAAGDRLATGAGGAGCDLSLDRLVIGGSFRYDAGDTRIGAFQIRAGMLINRELLAYPMIEWRVPDLKVSASGQFHVGAGIETVLFIPQISGFVEASTALAKFGPAATVDDVTVRAGVRIRQ